jgi:hypothetical protein
LALLPHAKLEAHVIPRTGHNLTKHLNAQDFFRLVIDFTDRVLGPLRVGRTDIRTDRPDGATDRESLPSQGHTCR